MLLEMSPKTGDFGRGYGAGFRDGILSERSKNNIEKNISKSDFVLKLSLTQKDLDRLYTGHITDLVDNSKLREYKEKLKKMILEIEDKYQWSVEGKVIIIEILKLLEE